MGGLRERMKVYRETVDNDMQNENDNKIRVEGLPLLPVYKKVPTTPSRDPISCTKSTRGSSME